MEQRRRADEGGLLLEAGTARGLCVFERLDGGEVAIGQDGVGQRPQMLRGLQLGRIRRQKQQVHVLGHAQAEAGMPPSLVQDEHDLFVWASTDLLSEGRQFRLKERDGDAGGQMKDGAPRGGMDEANQVTPLIAMLDGGERALPVEAPDFPQDRLEADAVLVDAPQLYVRVRERRRDRPEKGPDVFLKASCSTALACTWRGRGLRRRPSSRTR